MPDLGTANRQRVFEEGNVTAAFVDGKLTACGACEADGSLVQYSSGWDVAHAWESDKAPFAKLLVPLPGQDKLLAAVAESEGAQAWDVHIFSTKDFTTAGFLYRSRVPVRAMAANGDGSIV